MFKLRCPLLKKYLGRRKSCIVNQLFGENKNALFYGPKGHGGIDIRTQGVFKWIFHNLKGYRREQRTNPEKAGLIPVVAMHDGYLTVGHNDNKNEGIYMKVKDGKYETLYFHLDKVRVWKDDDRMTGWEKRRGKDFVKAGTVLGWCGNTGRYTTGAHLHIELRKSGKRIDPMPYFKDDVTYVRYYGIGHKSRKFYKGKEV